MWGKLRYRTKWIRLCFWKSCNMKQHSPIRITGGRFTREGLYKEMDKVWEAKESALLGSLEQCQAWRERGGSSFQGLEERPHGQEQWSSAEGHGRAEGALTFPSPLPLTSCWGSLLSNPNANQRTRAIMGEVHTGQPHGRERGSQGQSGSGRKKERHVVKMFQLIQFIF